MRRSERRLKRRKRVVHISLQKEKRMAQGISKATCRLIERLFEKIIFMLTPQKSQFGSRNYIFDRLRKEHSSIPKALPYIVSELVRSICLHTVKGFYLKMGIAQGCILFLFFASRSVLTPDFAVVLGLTFAGLLVNEAYLVKKERLEGEIITTVVTPVLIVLSYAAVHLAYSVLGWGLPHLIQFEALIPRIVWLGFVVAFVRYQAAPEPGPGHPYRGLLDVHTKRWYYNTLWLAGGFACMLAGELAAPSKWFFQGFVTVNPGVILFGTSIRLQLNPIGERYRHSMIELGLFRNPYEEEIKMKRDYLLTGADWLHNFSLQSFCEIMGFIFASSPLLIGVVEWYIGDPNAARIDWFAMGVNTAGWIVLIAAWPRVKKQNRETRQLFDQVVQTFKRGAKNYGNHLAFSNVMLMRGQI
jgi:hypothetical protein